MGLLETVAEDERGMAITLRVFNVNLVGVDVEKWFPEGTPFAVLEPYCEAVPDEGDASGKKGSTLSGIRVDHPSDVVVLQLGDSLIPKHWSVEVSTAKMGLGDVNVCERLKEDGNQAFKTRDYVTAIRRYVSQQSLNNDTCNDSSCAVILPHSAHNTPRSSPNHQPYTPPSSSTSHKHIS
jgi:hypothetical protein